MDDRFEQQSGTDSVAGLLERGEAAVSRQAWEEAGSCFAEARKIDPGSWKALQGLGVVGFWQGRRDDAWDFLMQAIRLAPQDQDNRDNLMDVARATGREAEARAILDALPVVRASPAEEICVKGEALLQAELWPEALRSFLEAIDRDAERSRAWSGLGIACFRSGLGNASRVFFEMAVRLDPRDEDAVLNWSESSGLAPDEMRRALESACVASDLIAKAVEVAV